MLSTAESTMTIPNQYRIGLYPFISQMGTLYSLSNNLTGARTAAGTLGSLLDTGQSTTVYGSGGTHFENAIPAVNTLITSVGDGSGALKPQPFVFLVTDAPTTINITRHRRTAGRVPSRKIWTKPFARP
jgi:hypothetical protein